MSAIWITCRWQSETLARVLGGHKCTENNDGKSCVNAVNCRSGGGGGGRDVWKNSGSQNEFFCKSVGNECNRTQQGQWRVQRRALLLTVWKVSAIWRLPGSCLLLSRFVCRPCSDFGLNRRRRFTETLLKRQGNTALFGEHTGTKRQWTVANIGIYTVELGYDVMKRTEYGVCLWTSHPGEGNGCLCHGNIMCW